MMIVAIEDLHGHRQPAGETTGDRTGRGRAREARRERDREADDRGSGLSRSRCGSPARTAAAVQTHKVRTHRDSARSLPASSSVCAPQRKVACGLFTAHAASRPTRVKGGRRTRLAAQDRPTPEGVGGKGLAPTHGASTQSTREHATTPHRGRERGIEDNNDPAHGQPPPPAAAAAVVVPRLPGVRNCVFGQCGVGVVVVGCRQTATQVPE